MTTAQTACVKAQHYVLGTMEAVYGGARSPPDVTACQVYTVYNLYPFWPDEIVRRGAAGPGSLGISAVRP